MMEPDIKISINKRGFQTEAILATCNEMSGGGEYYLIRKNDDGKHIDVLISMADFIDPSRKSEKGLRERIEEFKTLLNENQVRIKLLKSNHPDREQIVYNALSNPVFFQENEQEEQIPESIAKILEESSDESEESYLDDPLNIAVPWEEKGSG